MRIRSIKPEFWRSNDIVSLAIEDRLLFIGLWSYVDDNGVGVDEEASIVGDLFAADMFGNPRETVARVSRGLQTLANAHLIRRYSFDGRRYLQICAWDSHQRIDRPGKPRFPRYDAESRECRESVASVAGFVATGTEEQGSRGAEEQGSSSLSSEVAEATFRDDVSHILDVLDSEIAANGERRLPSRTQKNVTAARLLIDRDEYSVDEITSVIRWALADEFWKTNILSMSKVREKFSTLRAQMGRPVREVQSRTESNLDVVRRLEAKQNAILGLSA